MDSDLQEVCVDAVDKRRVLNNQRLNEIGILEKVCNGFSRDEFISAFFILMGNFGENPKNFLLLVKHDESALRDIFRSKCINYGINSNYLLELVGTMKNFKLLKDIGMCKHTFSNIEDRFCNISEIWKFYFSLCEDLDDDEILKLKSKLLPDLPGNICGEELFCHLILNSIITNSNLDKLQAACDEICPEDLIKRMKLFADKVSGAHGKQQNLEKPRYNIRNPTPSNPCGFAVIINQKKFRKSTDVNIDIPDLPYREGSNNDRDKLKFLWNNFGFTVKEYNNLDASDIIDLFQMLSNRDFTQIDVFVACILSHGIEGNIYGSDSKLVAIEDIISIVANQCPSLLGKPKLFFVQACQGQKHQKGLTPEFKPSYQPSITTDSRGERQMSVHPEYSDVYEVCATYPGFVSYRDETVGSIFISSLVKYLGKMGTIEDINSIMDRVKDDITNQDIPIKGESFKQMPVARTTLRKAVIFKHI